MADIIINKPEAKSIGISRSAKRTVSVSPATGGGGGTVVSGTPFASSKDNVITFYMYTLKQLEKISILTSAGAVSFTITFDQYDNYHLSYSSTSPSPLAGVEIEDDSKDMYDDNYIFKKKSLEFPAGWTIESVYADDLDNVLNEGDAWRLGDIQRKVSNINIDTTDLAKEEHLQWLEQFFGITGATDFVPASTPQILTELEDIWEEVTGEIAPLDSFAYNNYRLDVHNGVVSYHDVEENVLG